MKFQVFNSSYFCDKSNFEDEETQKFLIFNIPNLGISKRLLIVIICQSENLKDCLMEV